MAKFGFSFFLLIALGFLCTVDGNVISGLFGKSEDKAESEDKVAGSTASTAKSVGEATTTTTGTPEPSSSCGGLKGFLHICDKNEPTEPPKSVKTRSVPEEDDDSSENDSDSDSDSEDLEKDEEKQKASNATAAEPPEGGIAKRQVEGPTVTPPSEGNPEEDDAVNKRQVEDTEEKSEEEAAEGSRKRRDCSDRDGDFGKNCRKKREFVPRCTEDSCRDTETPKAN